MNRVTLKTSIAKLAATLILSAPVQSYSQQRNAAAPSPASNQRQFLERHCAKCHNQSLKSGGLNLAQADITKPDMQPEVWEKVVRKLRTGVMPPPNLPQPSRVDRLAVLTSLESSLDAASATKVNPGRTETLRRLNRTEYQNAIRDLLAVDIDAASLLPADRPLTRLDPPGLERDRRTTERLCRRPNAS